MDRGAVDGISDGYDGFIVRAKDGTCIGAEE